MIYFITEEEKRFVEEQFTVWSLTNQFNCLFSPNALIYLARLGLDNMPDDCAIFTGSDIQFRSSKLFFDRFISLSELSRICTHNMVFNNTIIEALALDYPSKIRVGKNATFDQRMASLATHGSSTFRTDVLDKVVAAKIDYSQVEARMAAMRQIELKQFRAKVLGNQSEKDKELLFGSFDCGNN
jgi:hypothetical protein